MAAESLYHFYFRKEDYRKAADCLDYFSKENPERKRKQALLYAETGETEKANQTYEEILLQTIKYCKMSAQIYTIWN